MVSKLGEGTRDPLIENKGEIIRERGTISIAKNNEGKISMGEGIVSIEKDNEGDISMVTGNVNIDGVNRGRISIDDGDVVIKGRTYESPELDGEETPEINVWDDEGEYNAGEITVRNGKIVLGEKTVLMASSGVHHMLENTQGDLSAALQGEKLPTHSKKYVRISGGIKVCFEDMTFSFGETEYSLADKVGGFKIETYTGDVREYSSDDQASDPDFDDDYKTWGYKIDTHDGKIRVEVDNQVITISDDGATMRSKDFNK